jgi:pyruvate-formate lyase-activating enzyme
MEGGTLFSLNYGKAVSACVDPIGKKPLTHFNPGALVLSVAAAGCNFRCPYCQNAGLIPLESGKEMDTDDIVKRLQRNLDIVDAAGFTGGEPCLQAEVA